MGLLVSTNCLDIDMGVMVSTKCFDIYMGVPVSTKCLDINMGTLNMLLFNKKQLDRTQVSQLRNVFSNTYMN